MTEINEQQSGWTEAERAGMRQLLRMGVILLVAIMVMGVIMALVSIRLETL